MLPLPCTNHPAFSSANRVYSSLLRKTYQSECLATGMLAGKFTGTRVETEELQLYPIRETDLPDLASWPKYQDPSLSWANFPASTKELQRRWLQHQKQNHVVWIMVRNHLGELIARCSFTQPLGAEETIFGIVVNPDYVEQGWGTKITRIALAYIFQITDIEAIWLESKHNNLRAHNTWRKVGFIEQGYHFRREVYGRYDKYLGFRFYRSQLNGLPRIEVKRNNLENTKVMT